MEVTIGPFTTCFLAVAVLTAYTYVMIYARKGLLYQNMKFVFAVISLILIRMLLPLNFPFTVSIYSGLMSPVSEILFQYIWKFPFGLAEILFAVWAVGAVYKLICMVRQHFLFCSYLNGFLVEDLETYPKLICVLKEFDMPELQVSVVPKNISPAIYGRRCPVLILPDWEFTERELYFICSHEISHYKNYDAWLNLFLGLVCCAQWFNPLAKQLRKELTLAYEVVNDQTVLKNCSEMERVEYADLILKTAQRLREDKIGGCGERFIGFCQPEVKIRVEYILAKEKERVVKKRNLVLHYAFIVGLFLVSFFIVPEAYNTKVRDDEGAFDIYRSDAYLVKSGEKYSLYVDGEYVYTMSNLYDEFKDLPVMEEDEYET